MEDALARCAIVEARIQEPETQLRLTKSGDQHLDSRGVVPDVVPRAFEDSEEMEVHRACLESTRKSVVEARAKRITSKAKSGSRSKVILIEAQVNAQAAKAAEEVLSARTSDLQADGFWKSALGLIYRGRLATGDRGINLLLCCHSLCAHSLRYLHEYNIVVRTVCNIFLCPQ